MSRKPSLRFAHHVLKRVALIVFLISVGVPSLGRADSREDAWLLVDSDDLTLTVMQDGRPQMTLHDLAIGRYGASSAKRRGDNTTPLGRFRVTQIEQETGFYRFIRLSYPDAARAKEAVRQREISQRELETILTAHNRQKLPPQNTVLGGNIGIHGLGSGDPELHRLMNWTKGCVALKDQQIESLLPWVRVGTMVEIR